MDLGQRDAGFRQVRVKLHRLRECSTSLNSLLFVHKCHAEEVMSHCELRFIFYHPLEERNCFVRIAFGQSYSRVKEASTQILTILFQNRLSTGLCFLHLPAIEVL